MRCLLLVVVAAACSHPEPAATAVSGPRITHAQYVGKARAAYEAKDWATCAAAFEGAERWYDAACCHAEAGHADAAFAALARADVRESNQLGGDPDLAPLHTDPRWAGAVAEVAKQVAAFKQTVNAELFDLYTADQGDRALPPDKMDWAVIEPRDKVREERVVAILDAGGAKVADDYYFAAMVFQHGHRPDAFKRAHDLCVKAVALDPHLEAARWLAAAALDRDLMTAGKPQKYGTQFQKQHGVWVLYEVDPTVTDAEREQWNVPPIAEARAKAKVMNTEK